MHDIELVAIWFLSVIAGVTMTMLLPQLVSPPSSRERTHQEWKDVPARDESAEHRGPLVRMGKGPDVYLVSTSWAWGTPRVTMNQSRPVKTRPPDRSTFYATGGLVIGRKRKEAGSRCAEQAEDKELMMNHEGAEASTEARFPSAK